MTDRELMQQALDVLQHSSFHAPQTIAALRERLAKNDARPCKIGGPCVPTESGPCACWELQQSPAPTTGNVLMDAYHAMQEKKQAARTTDRGPVDSAEKASAYLDARLWEFIDMAAAWPQARPDPRTWGHVLVYAPKRQELVKFNCTVVDDAHPEGVPLSQWGRQPVTLETVYETIVQWDEGGGRRSRRELARRIVALYANTGDTL